MYKNIIKSPHLCLLIGGLLAGCSGSDSTGNSINEAIEATPVYLTLDAMRSNRCDVTSPDLSARFLVHDINGTILNEYQTDANGHLSIEWTNESQHLTQITYNEPNNPDSGVIVSTYLNAPADDLGYLAHYIDNDIGCDCDEIKIDISELHDSEDFNSIELSAKRSTMVTMLSDMFAGEYTTNTIDWCANSITDLTLIDKNGFRTKATKMLFSPADNQKLTLNDFTDGVEVNATALPESSFLVAYTGFYRFYNDSLLFAENSVINDRAVLIYPDPDLNLSSMLYTHDYSSANLLDAHSNINLSSRQPIDSEGYSQPVELLPVDEGFIQAIEHIAMQMQLEADTVDFDFTSYDSNISSTIFKLYDSNNSYFENNNIWFIFGGREGTFPTLSLPQDIQAKLDTIEHKKISISLRKVSRYLPWGEWRAQVAKESRSSDPANEMIYRASQSIKIDFDLTPTNE